MNIKKTLKKHLDINRIFELMSFFPDEQYLKLIYYLYNRKVLHLKNPKTFGEKMQWLKLNDRNPKYTSMVDKYQVKKYVADLIGEEYIIPSYGVWNHFEDIDFDSLPEQFVLKCTHDSGGLVICKDKNKLDLEQAKKKIENSLKHNFFWVSREWPYLNVKPRILAEQYIENDEIQGLHDYKVWCFDGEPQYIQYITGRQSETFEAFYDVEWNKQNFYYHNPLMKGKVARPQRLEELLDFCRKLSFGTAFARVDFYVLEDQSLKFGEITFYPMCGLEKWHPSDMDYVFGELIHLPAK